MNIKNYKKRSTKDEQIKSTGEFFRKEISETRNFTRQLTSSKNYGQRLAELTKTVVQKKAH